MGTRRALLTAFVGGGLAVLGACAFGADAPAGPTSAPARVRIVLVGDSTMAVGNGWGPGFAKCVKEGVEVINLAKNGRSSKSFIAEGLWKKALALKPDWVLIQFGHNDQPGHGADRETDPQTTYKQYMTQYVDDARAAGIKPVLITSLSRRQWGADGKIHSTLVPNVEVVKEIAKEKGVPLVDLHARSIELYERIGKAGTDAISPPKAPAKVPATGKDVAATQGSEAGGLDGTHLNVKGQEVIGKLVAEEVKKVVGGLGDAIK